MNGNRLSDSLIRIELITHFHRYPGLECTPTQMAEAIGRDLGRVECQVKKLVQLQILDERPSDEGNRYRYVPPLSVLSFTGKTDTHKNVRGAEMVEHGGEMAG